MNIIRPNWWKPWLCIVLTLGAGLPLLAKHAKSYAELEAAIERERNLGKRAELLSDLAHMDFDLAHQNFDLDKVKDGNAHLSVARKHADEAVAAIQQESSQTGKLHGIKHVEIQFRKIAYALNDLARGVPVEQRDPVEDARKHFVDLRNRLLNMMFGNS